MADDQRDKLTPAADDARAFALIAAGMVVMLCAGFGFSALFRTPILAQIAITPSGIAAGVAATAPLAAFLLWFMNATTPAIVRFRDSQIEFFSQIGFAFTPTRIAIMAIGAGVTEEILFRGVFQTWIYGRTSAAAAILITNIVFGLLHARTALYAIIAGLVGAYLGLVFLLCENLIAPIITHALYDAAALELTRRAISSRRQAAGG